jgi:hypothetical protein
MLQDAFGGGSRAHTLVNPAKQVKDGGANRLDQTVHPPDQPIATNHQTANDASQNYPCLYRGVEA